MRKTTLFLFIVLATILRLSAQKVPLINREIFFDNPEITGAQISPDAKWMTFLKSNKGTLNIWFKGVNEPFDKARPITDDSLRPVRNYFWSQDAKYVLYVQDKGGNENYHIYALDPLAIDSQRVMPETRDLTPIDGARAYIYNVSKRNPSKMYIGLNNRDKAWHDLYDLDITTGALSLVRENKDHISAWHFDWDENLRLATRVNDDGSNEILRVDKDSLTTIYEFGLLESANPIAWTADNSQFFLATNKGKERNLSELVVFDPLSKTEVLYENDPMHKADFGTAVFSQKSHNLLYTTYTDAIDWHYFRDADYEADYNYLKTKFQGKELSFMSSDKEEKMWLINVYSDTDPGNVYLFNQSTRVVTFQYDPRPQLPREDLAPMEIITYKSSDGLEIPAYVTFPKGVARKNLPLIVVPHGGPWSRDYWGYNSTAQFWANRGYAVLRMNFRGSTGYGKAFLDAGNGQWGEKMQDDITWGIYHLIGEGLVDRKRIGITGVSYGGYATLAGVAFTPDMYRAAVAVVAPSNLNSLLGTIPPYWANLRKQFYTRMGDPTTESGKKQLERQSPLTSVGNITTPLMIVQGANDPRVNKAEADQIVAAMRERKIPVVYLCAPDEGHGFARPVNNMAYLAASEKFMAAQLGGRYQETMSDEVAKRLKEISVEVKPVEKVKPTAEVVKQE